MPPQPTNEKREPGAPRKAPEQILSRAYPVAQWVLERAARFRKSYRFTLGERVSLNALELLELITEALYTRSKVTLLSKADGHLTRLRILLRLALDSECLSIRQHEFITTQLDEVGRMLGGWIVQQRER